MGPKRLVLVENRLVLLVRPVVGVPIRLTEERWNHIRSRHAEMTDQRDRVLETVESPECVQQGDFGELLAVRHYPHTPLTRKFLVVAYRELSSDDGFVMTAYFTSRPSARRSIVWKP
jgi:hypothetical protein